MQWEHSGKYMYIFDKMPAILHIATIYTILSCKGNAIFKVITLPCMVGCLSQICLHENTVWSNSMISDISCYKYPAQMIQVFWASWALDYVKPGSLCVNYSRVSEFSHVSVVSRSSTSAECYCWRLSANRFPAEPLILIPVNWKCLDGRKTRRDRPSVSLQHIRQTEFNLECDYRELENGIRDLNEVPALLNSRCHFIAYLCRVNCTTTCILFKSTAWLRKKSQVLCSQLISGLMEPTLRFFTQSVHFGWWLV